MNSGVFSTMFLVSSLHIKLAESSHSMLSEFSRRHALYFILFMKINSCELTIKSLRLQLFLAI